MRALVLGLCFVGCVRPARPGAAATNPPVQVQTLEPVGQGRPLDDERISDAAPMEVFGDDGSCLPTGFRGPLRAARGNWRLYDASSGDGLLLEHVGEVLAIDETSVDGLRERLSSAIAGVSPINMLARGMCGDIHPRRGQCLAVGLDPGTDPFRAAELLDSALGPGAANLCYGVWVVMGTPVFLGS